MSAHIIHDVPFVRARRRSRARASALNPLGDASDAIRVGVRRRRRRRRARARPLAHTRVWRARPKPAHPCRADVPRARSVTSRSMRRARESHHEVVTEIVMLY